jgi:hypothetical protein
MERAPGTAWRAAPVSFKTFGGLSSEWEKMKLTDEELTKLVETVDLQNRRSVMQSLRLGAVWTVGATSLLGLAAWGASFAWRSDIAPILTVIVLGFGLVVGLLAFGLDNLSRSLALWLSPWWRNIELQEED